MSFPLKLKEKCTLQINIPIWHIEAGKNFWDWCHCYTSANILLNRSACPGCQIIVDYLAYVIINLGFTKHEWIRDISKQLGVLFGANPFFRHFVKGPFVVWGITQCCVRTNLKPFIGNSARWIVSFCKSNCWLLVIRKHWIFSYASSSTLYPCEWVGQS